MNSQQLKTYIENKIQQILVEEFPEFTIRYEIDDIIYSFFKDSDSIQYAIKSTCWIDTKEISLTIGPVIGISQDLWSFSIEEATIYAIVVANYLAKVINSPDDCFEEESEEDLDSQNGPKYLA